jgi:hypothetical protein
MQSRRAEASSRTLDEQRRVAADAYAGIREEADCVVAMP